MVLENFMVYDAGHFKQLYLNPLITNQLISQLNDFLSIN